MLEDAIGRPLRNLRLSVTDRCNLRCRYCMPEATYRWLPRDDILRFGEISRLVDVFGSLGVAKVRLTGGEPLLRRDLPELVERLSRKTFLLDLAMTTNGVLLADAARALREAGLRRVTISLDTLRPDRYRDMARRDQLAATLSGIEAAREVGFQGLKLDTVVMRGTNDDEIESLLSFALERGIEIRFIEYMDVPGATGWTMDQVVDRREILRRVKAAFGAPEPIPPKNDEERAAPARRYRLPGGGVFGVIASTTSPFCATCDRSRLTADGTWYLCLYAREGVDLKSLLRSGASDAALREAIAGRWKVRDDRGAEARLGFEDRGRSVDAATLRDDPRLEMHTRGG